MLLFGGNADRHHVTGWEKQRCQRNGPFSVYPLSTHTTRPAFQSSRLALTSFWIVYFVCRVRLPIFGFIDVAKRDTRLAIALVTGSSTY
ncbi:uncharacterized protein N7518_007221 [Penicillium psychrosexuale]|uniref:uncharacterized protein n=1 Tax=Penicillium psychrosexuale TaxID=1002107 RepID=UPI0025450FDC|nr:uncharacterized protein N7518_007221 [Penicillium psychrosexuale]KAJ5790210.1 hypothetical protein N7518_007221 [Penicillium psychrosexuale]